MSVLTLLFVALLQQDPIVVDMVRQPPITPEISYGSVLFAALGVLGVVGAAAVLMGLVVGAFIIWWKKRRGATEPVDHSHVRLKLS